MSIEELNRILDYIDNEFYSVMNRMSTAEKAARAKHWLKELEELPFEAAMTAVRAISEKGFPPRTAEIRKTARELMAGETGQVAAVEPFCRICRDAAGNLLYSLRFANGGGGSGMIGPLMEPWELIRWRWMATKKPEHAAAWEAIIAAKENGEDWESLAEKSLMTMVTAGGAA